MKNKIIYLLCIVTLIYSFAPRAYALENIDKSKAYIEENTDEDDVNRQFVFSPEIVQAMAGTDSFVTKTAGVEDFDVPCKAAFLIEENSGRELYRKNCDERMPMASITKIMTVILVMESLDSGKIKLSDVVPISKHAFDMGGSQIWLEPGEVFTVEELLKAVVVSSANDAAVALAEFVGGSEEIFCDMMNKKAEELGMKNTHFVNACGLDAENHYSSARDVSIMARELMKHENIYNYTTIWMDYLRNGQTQIVNTNKLLRSYSGITGLKTGTTSGAGICICATAKRDGLSLIAVVLGSPSSAERFSAARKLLDFGFANFEVKEFPETEIPDTLPVKFGVIKKAKISCDIPKELLFVKGSKEKISSKVNLPEYIIAPMCNGMKIGDLTLYSSQGEIAKYDIVLNDDIKKMNFSDALKLIFNKAVTM